MTPERQHTTDLVVLRRERREARAELAMLRSNLHDLAKSWHRRAEAAQRGGMSQIAMDYRDCADELRSVARGQRPE